MKDISDEQLRIAIAEWCGWRPSVVSNFPTQMMPPGETDIVRIVPKFTEDLNAMHEAEEKLTNAQRREYIQAVIKVHPLGYDPYKSCEDYMKIFFLANATARQRALALYLTINQSNDPKD